MDEVCLVIKAANQKYEDIKVNCNMSWTVGDLKNHLSINYPSKPKTADQRIIYSGHLLKDDQSLKNILGSLNYEVGKDHIFTFHLVCPQKPPEQNSTNENENKSSGDPTIATAIPPPIANNPTPSVSSFPINLNLQQQMGFDNLVMQQSYQTLLNEYYQYLSYCFLASPTMDMVSYNAFANAFLQSLQQNRANTLGQNVNSQNVPQASTANVNTNINNNVNRNQNNRNEAAQAAAAARVGFGENRDWADWIYSFSKLVVMLSIVYFYSSFNRLILFMLIFIIIYFYKNLLNGLNGPLNGNNRARAANQERRLREIFNQLREAGNRNINNNNNNNNEDSQNNSENDRQNDNNNNDDQSRFSGLRFICVFVTSLFTSLIPDPVPNRN